MIGPILRQVTLAVAIVLPSLTVHEGKALEPYKDIAGVDTYCFGETENVEYRHYTTSECLLLLAQRVSKNYEAPIIYCTDTPESPWIDLPITVRAASISLAYNIGVSAFCKSSVHRELKAGNLPLACDKFLLWNKARVNGRLREVQGLTNRRQDERALCYEGLDVAPVAIKADFNTETVEHASSLELTLEMIRLLIWLIIFSSITYFVYKAIGVVIKKLEPPKT